MRGHQHFYRKTKIAERVFMTFLHAFPCSVLICDFSPFFGTLTSRDIHVSEKINIIQKIENQLNISYLTGRMDFLRKVATRIVSGINIYYFQLWEKPYSKDYSLLLSRSPLLKERGLDYSLFRMQRKQGI